MLVVVVASAWCRLYTVPPLAATAHVVNASQDGTTPLHLAAGSGRVEAVQLLIRHGARVDARRKDGKTALFEAAAAGRINAAKALLEHGADPGVAQGTPVNVCFFKGNSLASLHVFFSSTLT